jgi:hypothetical protein
MRKSKRILLEFKNDFLKLIFKVVESGMTTTKDLLDLVFRP